MSGKQKLIEQLKKSWFQVGFDIATAGGDYSALRTFKPDSVGPPPEIFNKTWMKHLNSDLLYRYWKRKGYPGILVLHRHGVKTQLQYDKRCGIIESVMVPMFDQPLPKQSCNTDKMFEDYIEQLVSESNREYVDNLNGKPTLGIRPKWLYREQRISEIQEATLHRLSVKQRIPVSWIEEYNELIHTT